MASLDAPHAVHAVVHPRPNHRRTLRREQPPPARGFQVQRPRRCVQQLVAGVLMPTSVDAGGNLLGKAKRQGANIIRVDGFWHVSIQGKTMSWTRKIANAPCGMVHAPNRSCPCARSCLPPLPPPSPSLRP